MQKVNGEVPALEPVKVKGRVKLLKAISYKGSMIYIRQIDEEIFMYDLIYKEQLYSSYLIITPKAGKNRLTKNEVQQSRAIIFAGATATIDMLLGEKLGEKELKRAQAVVNSHTN